MGIRADTTLLEPLVILSEPVHAADGLLLCDRDGVIVHNRADYVRCEADLRLIDGAATALRRAQDHGFAVVIVSNQSVVGRGHITAGHALEIHRSLLRTLAEHGVAVAASYLCPHRPDEGCACRKPRPGMLDRAVARLGVPLERCLMVGDAHEDIRAARAAGIRAALVRTGRGAEHERRVLGDEAGPPADIVADLTAAVDLAIVGIAPSRKAGLV